MPAPQVAILAGPNGAGKTTLSAALLHQHLGVCEFVNADIIAQGLSRFDPEAQAFTAGRLMLQRLRQLAEARETFAFETTLASRAFVPFVRECQQRGYRFQLLYLWLPNADEAVRRVHLRVSQGGHSVPDDVIRRRYHRGLRNFIELYRPLSNQWHVYNAADRAGVALVASGIDASSLYIHAAQDWELFLQGTRHDSQT